MGGRPAKQRKYLLCPLLLLREDYSFNNGPVNMLTDLLHDTMPIPAEWPPISLKQPTILVERATDQKQNSICRLRVQPTMHTLDVPQLVKIFVGYSSWHRDFSQNASNLNFEEQIIQCFGRRSPTNGDCRKSKITHSRVLSDGIRRLSRYRQESPMTMLF